MRWRVWSSPEAECASVRCCGGVEETVAIHNSRVGVGGDGPRGTGRAAAGGIAWTTAAAGAADVSGALLAADAATALAVLPVEKLRFGISESSFLAEREPVSERAGDGASAVTVIFLAISKRDIDRWGHK